MINQNEHSIELIKDDIILGNTNCVVSLQVKHQSNQYMEVLQIELDKSKTDLDISLSDENIQNIKESNYKNFLTCLINDIRELYKP